MFLQGSYYIFLRTDVEKAVAPHSSTLAWKLPWTEEPGGLQSMGSLQVGHDWATSLSLFTFMPFLTLCGCEMASHYGFDLHFPKDWCGEGSGNPLQCSCLENPRDGRAWWAAVKGSHRVGHDWSDLAAAAAAANIYPAHTKYHSELFTWIDSFVPLNNFVR